MISARHAPALCVLLAAALIPTVIHSYVEVVVPDRLSTTTIGETLAGFSSAPSGRDAGWGMRRFEGFDWFERRYMSGPDEVILTVIRSYDLKRLYHHPELDVAYGTSFTNHDVRHLPGHGSVPMHVLRTGSASGAMALYVLHYDGGFVENPVWFQIRTAGTLLFSGRKPMTLLFARDASVPSGADVATLPVAQLLLEAVSQFAQDGASGK